MPRAKVADYLLDVEHPVGGAKVAFFEGVGFTRHDWRLLRDALVALAATGDVESKVASRHGMKYIVRGMVETPRGGSVGLVTVWMVPKRAKSPRFVTAFPARKT